MKEHIIREIQRLSALNGGRPPGQNLFARETGIAAHQWLGRYWSKWSDALLESGLKPNNWVARLDSGSILSAMAEVCIHFGRLPSKAEYELHRKSNPALPSSGALSRHFGMRVKLIQALANHAQLHSQYAAILTMLPPTPLVEADAQARALNPRLKTAEGFVYLIQSGDFYKVGRSDDLERRVKEIRIALPDKAVLIHSIRTDDPSGIEAYWHQRFKEKRANGEWFRLGASDVAGFKKRKFQ